MANAINVLVEEREARPEEDKAVLEPPKELVEAPLWLLAFTLETIEQCQAGDTMKAGRQQNAKEEKREARDWLKLCSTEMNDESLEKCYNPLKIKK